LAPSWYSTYTRAVAASQGHLIADAAFDRKSNPKFMFFY
jgi:hypothetical protein